MIKNWFTIKKEMWGQYFENEMKIDFKWNYPSYSRRKLQVNWFEKNVLIEVNHFVKSLLRSICDEKNVMVL